MNNRATHKNDVRVLVVMLASAGVIILGCLILNGFTWVRLQKSVARQSLALDRLAQYASVLATLQDVELGQRGYLLSGEDFHHEVFSHSRERFAAQWERLVTLEVMSGKSKEDLREIREVSDNLVTNALEAVFVRRTQSRQAAEELFLTSLQRYAMADVRIIYRSRMDDLDEEIRKGNTVAENDFQAGLATSMAMGVLALGIGWIALFLLKRVLKEIKRSERYALSMLKAEEARRQKDVFLAMMSHEIRTPLNAIIGFGQLAQQEEMGEKGQRYVKSILEGGQSLLLLINDILDLSKLQAGRMELNAEPTHLRDLLKFMERLFQETCSAKGVRLRFEYQESLPTSLVLDSVRLRQVLMNLIGNAVKFTDEGEVLVRASGAPESGQKVRWCVKLEISDTGPGIETEDIDHIFEPFYQSNSPQPVHKKGTGLGLSIVQRFVKLMNGELHVTSKEGRGSAFTVVLKDLAVSARLAPERNLGSASVDFNRLKPSLILAVDDNATNLELIREIFCQTHHQVITACNGEDAINLIRDSKPDLVLMDMRMPVKDGPTAAREIKTETEYKLTPIIAVTAGSMPGENESPLLGDDFDGALRKPFTRQEMFDALALFLKEESHQQPLEAATEELQIPPSPQVIQKLKELLAKKWPEVKSRMTMSEVVEFAREVAALTEGIPCTCVDNYAAKLQGAAESFSFGEMEAVLGQFPDLVAELEEAQ